MPGNTLRLSLEVERDSEPIKGSLAAEQGERRAFQGWMELAAALLALTEAPPAQPHPEVQSPATATREAMLADHRRSGW